MVINKPAPKVPAGATKIPADGTFHKVGPLPSGNKPSAKPADNQPKTK